MEHLAALIARCKRGLSVRKIAEDAGVAHNRLAYYLKPASNVTRLPEKDTIEVFARALGCTEKEVVKAFLADIYGMTGDINGGTG